MQIAKVIAMSPRSQAKLEVSDKVKTSYMLSYEVVDNRATLKFYVVTFHDFGLLPTKYVMTFC